MDPGDAEFQRTLLLVGAGGLAVTAVGVTVLFLAFRAFGPKHASGAKPIVLLGGLVIFIFACCAALLVLSFSDR